jgi:glycosyltransferase involved in cell wall biosynthesis
MRILQIHNRYRQQGGEDVVVAAEHALLAGHGHELSQFIVENPRTTGHSLVAMARATWNRASADAVTAAIRAHKPDVVHVHNTWFQLSPAVVAAAHARKPVVMTLHNYRLVCANAELLRDGHPCRLCLDGSLWNGVIHSCYRDPVSSGLAALTIAKGRKRVWHEGVDRYLTLSNFATSLFSDAGISTDRITVKDNFVTDPGLRVRPASEAREILFVGRLSPEKGIEQLLARHRQFVDVGLELNVIGDGPMRPLAERTLGPAYLGPRPEAEVASHMLGARALVVPSLWYEGQPRVVLEAFAAGLPVFGSSLGALGELLAALPGNWTFDPLGEWTDALARVGRDDEIAMASRATRLLWEKRFAPDQAVRSLERVYDEAREEHRRHG